MFETKSFNLAQPKRQDGWVSFQAWTRKWNRFFATIFCVLSFLLLFAIVIVNVVETEHEILPEPDRPMDELKEFNILLDIIVPHEPRSNPHKGCVALGDRITCQGMSIDDIDQELRLLIKPRMCTKFELQLWNIDFPSGNLSKGWMTVESCSCAALSIVDSPSLRLIDDGVFDSRAFLELKDLKLTNISVTEFKDATLKGLPRLESLQLQDLVSLDTITDHFLEPVKKLLKLLVLENTGIASPNNLTGSQMLNELETIDFRSNNFTSGINDKTFRYLPHLTSLNLTKNCIQSLTKGVFDDIATTVKVIDLRWNRLKSLPEGIFSSIRGSVFRIYLQSNVWRCNCALAELKSYLSDPATKNWFDQPLICSYPLLYRYMDVIEAPFCRTTTPNPEVTTPEEPLTTEEEPQTTIKATAEPIECQICVDSPHEELNCSHSEYATSAFYFHEDDEAISVRRQTLTFRVDQNEEGILMIIVKNPNKIKYVVFWFAEEEKDIGETFVTNEKVCAECTVLQENRYKVSNLKPDYLYIFCLMKYSSKEISPFDCLPYKTKSIPGAISWLERHDKFLAYTISVLALLMCSFVGAFIMYCIIRKMPTLLKGSERVIIVKDKEIIVMPNGKCQKKLSKMDSGSSLENSDVRQVACDYSAYLTPIPGLKPIYRKIHHRRASDTSLDSIRSYISTKAPEGVLVNRTTCYSDFQGRCFLDLKDVPNTPPPLPQRRSFESDAVDYASIAKSPDANIYTPFDYGTTIAVKCVKTEAPQELIHTVHM